MQLDPGLAINKVDYHGTLNFEIIGNRWQFLWALIINFTSFKYFYVYCDLSQFLEGL